MSLLATLFTRVATQVSKIFPADEELTPQKALQQIGTVAIASGIIVYTLFPLYWTLNTSLKPSEQTVAFPPEFIPRDLTFAAYHELLTGRGLDVLINSLIISVGATALALLVGVPAGYAYARGAEKIGGKHSAFWILSIRMFPPIAPILPLFFIFRRLGMIDTYPVMILLYLTFNVPLVVWLMRSFFQDIPIELEEAAMIDGYSRFQAFYKVTLPLVTPGLVATTLLTWVFSWNEFIFALVFTRRGAQTYPVLIPSLVGGHETLWHMIAALSILAIIPVTIIALVLQKRLVRGLTLGAVKG